MSGKRLVLVDGMSHIYRAYYAIPRLSNSKGFPTNAIYGFTTMLRKLVEEEKPDYIGVAFDLEGPTVRHEKFEAYKATRKPMPEDLSLQIPYITKVCEVFRVPVISYPGYEADDVLGTLARKAVAAGLNPIVVTSDKDMMQLVNDHIRIMDPMKDNQILDAHKVVEKLGVKPEQVPDLLGLWGDASDNIPGAPGIGEKGAKELIQTFGTLENTLKNWEKVKRKTYQESLRDNAELIRISRELATIHQDLPLELDLDALVLSPPDRKAAFQLFAELEFKSLMMEFLDEQRRETPKAKWLSPEDAGKFVKDLEHQPHIYLVLKLTEEALARKAADAVCVSTGPGAVFLLDLKNEAIARTWEQALRNPALTLVCWDAKLCRLAQERRGLNMGTNVEDAMVMAFLTAPHVGDYTLKHWALEKLHISLPGVNLEGFLLTEAARDEIAQALSLELEALRLLYELLTPQMESLGVRRLYQEIELPLIPVLAEMERTGVKVDPNVLRSLSTEMEEQLTGLTRRIYEAAGVEFNINSPKQLGEILFEKLNLPMMKKTRKTKGYSTDQAVLEELAESYELPRLILEYRQFSKLKSTYVDTLPALINDETGRVHTSFNQTGTATGRLSSSDPNLQNIPIRTELGRRIRGAFIPEKGYRLVSADYSQVELRVLADLSEDEVLVDAFRHNEDIHERTAREVFSEAERANRAECRRRAKVINFGIVYGLSAFGLAQRLGISREDAQAFIDAYFTRYKGVRNWLDRTIEEARRTGLVRTLFGRIRPIPDIHSKDYAVRQFAERTAVNTPIQGTAADIIKIAMIRIWKVLHEKELSSRILLQVHDELVLESPEREVEKVQEIVRQEMENAVSLKVPLRVDMGLGDSWMEMK
ncbi:MAG: DNA polymerase I [Acidobacteriia bacterium]|nr:DNA polymerase I [Terriglobia bacterium]